MMAAVAAVDGHDALSTRSPARADRLSPVVLLFLLCVILPVRFYAGPLLLTNLRVFLLLLIVPLGINLLRGRYGPVLVTDWAIGVHLLWQVMALAVTTPESVVTQTGSSGAEFVGGYLVGRAFIRTSAQFYAFARLLAWTLLLVFPLTLYELNTGHSLILDVLSSLPGVGTEHHNNMEGRMGFERVQMSFPHPIHFGLFACSVLSIVFVGLKGDVSSKLRWAAGGVIAFSTFASLSSGALLPMLLQIGLIGWAWALRAVRRRWLVLLALFVLAYVVIDLLSNRTPIRVMMSYATFNAHTAYWRGIIFDWGILNIFGSSEHGIPSARLFGIGLSDWVRPHFMNSASVDNYWLLTGMRFGIPGFLTIAFAWFWTLWKIGRLDFAGDASLKRTRLAWVFTFVALALTLCTVHIWSATYSYVYFLFGAGMWLFDARPGQLTTPSGEGEEAPVRSAGRYTRFGGEWPQTASRSSSAAGPGAPLRRSPSQKASRFSR